MSEINNRAISKEIVGLIDSNIKTDSELGINISSKEAKEIYAKYESLKQKDWLITREKLAILAESLSLDKNASLGAVIRSLEKKSKESGDTQSVVGKPAAVDAILLADAEKDKGDVPSYNTGIDTATTSVDEKRPIPMAMSGRQDEKLTDSKYSFSDIISTNNQKRLSAKLHYISDIDVDGKTEVLNDNHWYNFISKDGQTDIYGEAQLLNLLQNFTEDQLDEFIKRFIRETPNWTIGSKGINEMHKKFHENFSIQANEIATIGEMISPKGGRAGLNALIEGNVEQYYSELRINKEDIPAIQARLEMLKKKDPSLFEKIMGGLATIGVGIRNFPFLGMLAGVAGEKQSLQVMRTTDKNGKEQVGIDGKQPAYKDFNIGSLSFTARARFLEGTLGLHTGAIGQEIINSTESFIKNLNEKISPNGNIDPSTLGDISLTEKSLIEAYNKNLDKIGPDGKNILIEALGNMHMFEMAQKNPNWHFKGVEAGISFWNLLRGSPPFFFGIFFEKLGTAATTNNTSNANAVVESGANAKKTSKLGDIGISSEIINEGKDKKFTTLIPFPKAEDDFSKQLIAMGATIENVNGNLVITVSKDTYLAFGKRKVVTSETISTFYVIQEIKLDKQGAQKKIGKLIESTAYVVDQKQDTLARKDILETFAQLGGGLYLARRHDLGGKSKAGEIYDGKNEKMYQQFDRFFQYIGDEQYTEAIAELTKIHSSHAKNLLKLINTAATPEEKRAILVSALSFTYGGKHTRILDKVNDINDVIHDYTQKLSAEAKLIPPNEASRAFFTHALNGLKRGDTLPTKQLKDFPDFQNRIIGSAMCATPLGGKRHLDALPGSSEVFDPIWIDEKNSTMSKERKEAILEKSTTTIALGVSEMNKFLSAPNGVFTGKGLSITPDEYKHLLLMNELPKSLKDAGVQVKDPAIFFDAIACIQGSKCLNDQGGVVHTTIQGAPPPPVIPPADDIASLGVGVTVGTKDVTVWAFDPSLMAKTAIANTTQTGGQSSGGGIGTIVGPKIPPVVPPAPGF